MLWLPLSSYYNDKTQDDPKGMAEWWMTFVHEIANLGTSTLYSYCASV